ncbi:MULTISPECIES: hypothetical protein [Bacillus]|uniref:hypothetical protein n=1 Tax=Bacillus TaxID=1386 RepID=UPI0002E89011|nr:MULTISPECIES: hypothetical protein [Bacillus]
MSSHNSIQSILGVNVRARKSTEAKIYDPFKNPIIHKRIDGLEIVVIDTERLWGR